MRRIVATLDLFTIASRRRCLWWVMAVAHAPGLVAAWRTILAGGFTLLELRECTLLTLTTLFFALKIADVAFLRFNPDFRSRVALVVAIAFLHLGLIAPADQVAILPEYGPITATALLVVSVVPLRRARLRATQQAFAPRHRLVTSCANRTVWIDQVHPRCRLLPSRSFTLRAPPVC